MAITFLDEEEDIVATAEPQKGKSRITFLDEEEPVETPSAERPKITFLDEGPTPAQPAPPVGTSFFEEVAAIPQAFIQGIDQPTEAMAETATVLGMPALGETLRGAVGGAEGYVPAAQRFMQPQEGEFQIGGFAPQFLPRAIVEQAGQIAGAIATRAAGGAIGGLAGSAVGPKGTVAGAVAGQFLGPALFEMSQVVGPVARERAANQGRETPNGDDLGWAWATAGASGALNAIGARYLPNGDKLAGGLAKRISQAFIGEGIPEGGQAAVQQIGETFLTEQGLDLRPKEIAGEALIGGGAGAAAVGVAAPFTKASTAAETKVVAEQAAPVAPETAQIVSEQANQVIAEAQAEETAETPDERVARLQREAQEAAGEIELEEEGAGLPPQPVTPTPEATPVEPVAPVEPVLPAEGARPPVTPEVVPKAENAVVEAEQKSEQESDTVKVFRGVAEAGALPAGGAFFTDSERDASAYAQLAALRKATEENEDFNDIVSEVMAEEGANDITDLSINTIKSIIEGNNIQVGDISEGAVLRGNIRLGNVLNLESFGSEVGSLPETWNELNELGLVPETWESLDEDVQEELSDKYRGKAFYSLLEGEVNLNDQFAKGIDTIVFTDQNTEGRGTHRTYLTKAAEQFAQEAAPAAVEPTPVAPPPVTPQLEPLRRVARAEQTEEDVAGLVDAGFVEVYNGQPVLTQAGIDALPEAERPRLTPEARKIQIDTRTSEAAAEAISKNLRIGVDQVPVDVRMPEGWTLVGDVYVPPKPMERITEFKITPEYDVEETADVFAAVQKVVPPRPVDAEPETATNQEIQSIVDKYQTSEPVAELILANMNFEAEEAGVIPEGWVVERIDGQNLALSPVWQKSRRDIQVELRKLTILERGAISAKLVKEGWINEDQAKEYLREAITRSTNLSDPNREAATERAKELVTAAEAEASERFDNIVERTFKTNRASVSDTVADVSKPTVDLEAEEQARAKKPRISPWRVLDPNEIEFMSARQALKRLADSNVILGGIEGFEGDVDAQGNAKWRTQGNVPKPRYVLLQEAASVLAQTKLRALDVEKIQISGRPSGRAYRDWTGDVFVPRTQDGDIKYVEPWILVHEIAHSLTVDSFSKHLFQRGVTGADYYNRLKKTLTDKSVPKEVRRAVKLYLDTIKALNLEKEYFKKDGLAGDGDRGIRNASARELKKIINPFTGQEITRGEMYALSDIYEFYAQAWNDEGFQDILKQIKVEPQKTVFQKFVDIIKDILGFESDSMAYAVIDASLRVASLEEISSDIKTKIERTKAFRAVKELPRTKLNWSSTYARKSEYISDGVKMARNRFTKLGYDQIKFTIRKDGQQSWALIASVSEAYKPSKRGKTYLPSQDIFVRFFNNRATTEEFAERLASDVNGLIGEKYLPLMKAFSRPKPAPSPQPPTSLAPTPEVREARREPAITPQQDRDYLAAVERGDSGNDNLSVLLRASKAEDRSTVYQQWAERNPRAAATVLRVVNELAEKAGFTSPIVFHGSIAKGVTRFDVGQAVEVEGGIFFTTNEDVAAQYTFERAYGDIISDEPLGEVTAAKLRMDNPFEYQAKGKIVDAVEMQRVIDKAKADGFDGVIIRNIDDSIGMTGDMGDVYVVFNGNQIKSADPVTYDDQGNIIPLSQRFQPEQADIRYSYAGVRAQTPQFMRDSLSVAQAMAAKGEDAEAIRSVTGWIVNPYDGKLRWEIPDNDARFVSSSVFANAANAIAGGDTMEQFVGKLGDILDHKPLFDAYPDLKNVEIFMANLVGTDAEFRKGSNIIPSAIVVSYRANPSGVKSLILHEIQHWIQNEENFAKGGNLYNLITPEYLSKARAFKNAIRGLSDAKDKILRATEAIAQEKRKKSTLGFGGPSKKEIEYLEGKISDATQLIEKIWENQTKIGIPRGSSKAALLRAINDVENKLGAGWNLRPSSRADGLIMIYERLAGEIEARDVQARMELTAEQRRAVQPYSSENISPEDAIVMEQVGVAALRGRRIQMGRAGMETSAVEARLQELGFPTGGIIRVVNQPDADFEGRTIILDGKVTGIELNAAAMRDNATIDRVLNHEFAESANADGALNRLVERLTPKEKKEINDTITRLRYEERARTSEEAARAIETLAESWKGRGFFTRAVARVEAWASKLGFKLTRRAAEYIAARNLADINSGFRTAYNRFINVKGEAREGRAFVTPEENARFLELAKDPEANRGELQKMVEDAAFRAGYTIRAFHGTSEEFTTFDTSLRNLDTARYGEGLVFFTNNPDLAQEYAQLGSLEFRRANAERETAINEFEKISEDTFPDLQRIAIERRGLEIANERVASGQITQEQYNAWVNAENRVFDATQKLQDLQKLPARPKVMPVFLKMDQPVSEKVEGQEFFGSWNFVLPNLVEQMRSRGGDGVIAEGVYDSPFGTPLKSTVYAIPNSQQAKSADPITYDSQGNVIPLEQRFQPTTTDIRYARREVRESRREPEAIPTFTEGTPEAATLKEMATSMAKVDAASEAKGGKPETYKISDIASNWMDQGGDERALQDAIVENTNLTPANAARVAKAIARQYDIQQGLTEARAQTAEGVSVEAIPEGATVPEEADPKRPKTTLQRVIDAITGVRVPPVKITANEKTLLKEQIKLKAAATREAKKAQQEMAADVVEAIKAMDIRGGLRPKQISALMKRAALINFASEKSVDRFTNYAEKVIANANYDRDLSEAKLAQKRARELAKSKRVPSNQQDVLNGIADIEVGFLDDPREFAEAANHYMRAFKSVVSEDYVVVPDDEMTSYLSAKEDEAGASRSDFDLESITALAEKYGVSVSDVNNIINAQDTEAALAQYANREVFEGLLSEKAKQSLSALKKYDASGMTQSQQSMVAKAIDLDVEAIEQQDKIDLVRRIDNILVNGRTNGFQKYVDIAEAQSNARKAARDGTFTDQMAAWINILTGKAIGRDITLVGKKQQKELALTMQSVADTFRNIFGKKQLGKAQRIIGHFDLIKATTAANNDVDAAGEQMEKFYSGQYKKYGKVLSAPETIMAEGIAGYLIQSVPFKSEGDSIAQRRRLIQEDIRARREDGDQEMIESADMIEEQLAKVDGDSVREILNNLKSSHPAAYESLIWMKDTLLPQYKDFLKAHDENYNDQTNNYENPNYLPIKYKFVGAIDLMEDSGKYARLDSLTPKQAANTIKRVDYSTLPKRKGTTAQIDYSIRKNVFNSLAEQLRKAHTSSAWTKIDAFLKSKDAPAVFGGRVNVNFMADRLKLLKDSQERRSYEWRGDAKFFDALATISRKFGIGYALGGIYQPFKQVPDQLMTTVANTGRTDLLSSNFGVILFQPKTSGAMNMLSKFSIGRRGDAAMGGTKFVNEVESNYTNLERYFNGGNWAKFKERAQKLNDIWLYALKKSDYTAAAASWMTYYQAKLAQDGIKFTDWNQEAQLVETDTARQEAAAYAESMTDIYQGSSDPTNMATFAQRGKSGYENIFKAIFMPLNSFALQQRSRIMSDGRDAMTKSTDPERMAQGRYGLAATLGGMTLFHYTRRFFLPAVSGLGATAIYAILGIDPEEPDEEKKAEMAKFRWRQFTSELAANMFVGGFGSLPEVPFIDALNRAAYFGAEQVDSETLYNDKGEKMSYSAWTRNNSPFWRYKEYGSGMNLGMLDITSGQIGEVADVTRKLLDPERYDTLTEDEKRLIYFAALSEWLYTLRLNDTDMNRMIRNMAKETEMIAKEREKELKRIREGR